jgi:hypothetical protein
MTRSRRQLSVLAFMIPVHGEWKTISAHIAAAIGSQPILDRLACRVSLSRSFGETSGERTSIFMII